MSFLHKQSNECAKSELDFFQLPPTQVAAEAARIIEYYPQNSTKSSGPIQFDIYGSSDEYIDPSQIFLYLEANILDADSKELSNDMVCTSANNLLHTAFEQVDLQLNDTVITPASNTYPYRAMIETLFNYGNDAKESHLQAAMYFKDDSGQMDSLDLVTSNTVKALNTGFVKRNAITNKKPFDMFGRLHLDFFFQDRYRINNVNMKLKLIRAKIAFV
jgi:hypothetical protein